LNISILSRNQLSPTFYHNYDHQVSNYPHCRLFTTLCLTRTPNTPSPPRSTTATHKIKISTTILPSNSKEPARITIGFKEKQIAFVESKGSDKKGGKAEAQAVALGMQEGELDLRRLGINDVVEEVDRYSRGLARKEELTG